MLWMMVMAALLGAPESSLDGVRACGADEQPFGFDDQRADWYWRFDRIVIGEVVAVNRGRTQGDAFFSATEGTYRLRPVRWLKGGRGLLPLPLGKYQVTFSDDGQYFDNVPPIGQLEVYVEQGRDRGWSRIGKVRCLPIPPA